MKNPTKSETGELAEQNLRTIIPMDPSQYHTNLQMQSLLMKKMIRNGRPGFAGLNHTNPHVSLECNDEAASMQKLEDVKVGDSNSNNNNVPKRLTEAEARGLMVRDMAAYNDAQRLINPNYDNGSKADLQSSNSTASTKKSENVKRGKGKAIKTASANDDEKKYLDIALTQTKMPIKLTQEITNSTNENDEEVSDTGWIFFVLEL
ncbi:hypothetical protein E4T39_02045 [Aureobasidium subglaciale]|nr:hypothetical protein E4T39_02045 [Aureobasidium subglaciale]